MIQAARLVVTRTPRGAPYIRRLAMAYPSTVSSPTDLLTALPAKFEEARRSGQLYYFPSEARDIHSHGRRVRHHIFHGSNCTDHGVHENSSTSGAAQLYRTKHEAKPKPSLPSGQTMALLITNAHGLRMGLRMTVTGRARWNPSSRLTYRSST